MGLANTRDPKAYNLQTPAAEDLRYSSGFRRSQVRLEFAEVGQIHPISAPDNRTQRLALGSSSKAVDEQISGQRYHPIHGVLRPRDRLSRLSHGLGTVQVG